MAASTNTVFRSVTFMLLGLRRLVRLTSPRFTNRRFVFTLAALAIIVAKLIHIYSHATALTTRDLKKWGYSFFTQDVLLLIITRFLLDTRHFPPRSSMFLQLMASSISSLFIGFVTTLNIINICFFVVNGSEIHWRNVSVAGDAAGRALVLSGLVSSLVVPGVLVILSWILQDFVFTAVGLTTDIITRPVAYATRGRFCGVRLHSPNNQYHQVAQSDAGSAAKTEDRLERKPIGSAWIHLILYTAVAIALLAQIILSLVRPHHRSLVFMSWTSALLPFVDFEKTALNLENINPRYNSAINHEWDNQSALRKPISLPWLPDYQLDGFEDWYEDELHYDASADPFKISNLEEALLPQLGDLSDVPIRHVMIIVLESTRKDVFPIKNSGVLVERLRDSWDNHTLPEDVLGRLKTLTPVAKFLTGDYDDHFDHPVEEKQKRRGGMSFNDAYTTSTLTMKSLTGSLCGVNPMVADFNVEYKHHIYQPCLPHILDVFHTLGHKDEGRYEFGGYKWASTFMQSVTLTYDHFGALMEKVGFPSDGLIDKEYLIKNTAKFGKVDLPDVNYFGFEETPLEDYIRDEFEMAKENDGRVFLTHITSTTHHPYNMPKNETYVPLGKGLGDLSHYVNAIGYGDRWLGRILDTIDDLDVANETLLIFVGDHGLSIPENDILATYYNPHNVNNHVPLVLSHPKLPQITIDDAVSTQQILPTILDLLVETGSLSGSATNAARDLLGNYEGQSLLRPVRKESSKSGAAKVAYWQFTIINPGSTMLGIRDARFKSWRIVVPLVGNQEWQYVDTDRRDVEAVAGFEFSEFQQKIEESYGKDPARWIEEAAFVARWFVNENSKRWRYSLYEPDMASVLIPQGIAAMANVLSGWVVLEPRENHATLTSVAHRAPHMILWIWLNLFTLGLANQRLERSIQEGRVNKPWRPIPANRLTAGDAQRVLSVAIPVTLGASIFLGDVQESLWMASLNWLYNDLGAANGRFAVRNLFSALELSCFSVGATRVLQGCGAAVSPAGYVWTALVGCCIFTTISLQDLYDLEGDLVRGRRTAPIVLGPMWTRVVTALMVLGWSIIVLAYVQGTGYVYSITLALGHFIAIRIIQFRSVEDDKITFKAWCLWMTVMYVLPLLSA
ncbi:hypothetical protein ZTR_09033 [Talaromyces verruculosus]|nr:hypothetical protein ZTR_09033 [Talaromyces verruculosus]